MNNLLIILKRNFNNKFIAYGFVIFLSTLMFFIRVTDAFTNPQFWAEDAKVFWMGARELGFYSIFEPYAGYIHFIQRVYASLLGVLSVPPQFVPLLYNLFSYIVSILCILILFNLPLSGINKILLSLTIAFVPVISEVYINLTNIQWITAGVLTLVLCCKSERSVFNSKVLTVSFIFISGLTGPFSILLFPLILLRILVYKDIKKSFLIYFSWAAAVLTQLSFLTTSQRLLNVGQSEHIDILLWFDALINNLFGEFFYILPQSISMILVVLVLALSLYNTYIEKQDETFVFILGLVGMYFVFSLSSFYNFKIDPTVIHPFSAGARYFYVPNFILSVLIVRGLLIKNRAINMFFLALTVLTTLTVIYESPRDKFRDLKWKDYSIFIDKVDLIKIPINPNWEISVSSNKYNGEYENNNLVQYKSYRNLTFNNDGTIYPMNNDPQIYLNKPKCDNSDVILFIVDIFMDNPTGKIQFYYSDDLGNLSENDSITREIIKNVGRYYFSVPSYSKILRLDPISEEKIVKINRVSYMCGSYEN